MLADERALCRAPCFFWSATSSQRAFAGPWSLMAWWQSTPLCSCVGQNVRPGRVLRLQQQAAQIPPPALEPKFDDVKEIEPASSYSKKKKKHRDRDRAGEPPGQQSVVGDVAPWQQDDPEWNFVPDADADTEGEFFVSHEEKAGPSGAEPQPALQRDSEVLNTAGDVIMVESSDDDSAGDRNLLETAKVAEELDVAWPPLQQPGTEQQGSILEEITAAAAHTANIAFQNSWHPNTAAARIVACLGMNAEHRRQRDIEDDTVHAAVKAFSAVTSWESLKDPSGPLACLYEHASRDELQPGDGKTLIHAIIDEEEAQESLMEL